MNLRAMPQEMSGDWVRLICTDRGQHPPTKLVRLWARNDGALNIEPLTASLHPDWLQACVVVPGTEDSRLSALRDCDVWEIHCPRCTRRPRLRKAHLHAAATAAIENLDVSLRGQ